MSLKDTYYPSLERQPRELNNEKAKVLKERIKKEQEKLQEMTTELSRTMEGIHQEDAKEMEALMSEISELIMADSEMQNKTPYQS